MRLGLEHATQEARDVLWGPTPRLGVSADGGPAGEAVASVPARGGGDVLPGPATRDREVIQVHRHVAAAPGPEPALETRRPLRVEVVVGVRVSDDGGLRPRALEPLRVAATGLRGRVVVAPAQQEQQRRAGHPGRGGPVAAVRVERHVRGEVTVVVEDRAPDRLERGDYTP